MIPGDVMLLNILNEIKTALDTAALFKACLSATCQLLWKPQQWYYTWNSYMGCSCTMNLKNLINIYMICMYTHYIYKYLYAKTHICMWICKNLQFFCKSVLYFFSLTTRWCWMSENNVKHLCFHGVNMHDSGSTIIFSLQLSYLLWYHGLKFQA